MDTDKISMAALLTSLAIFSLFGNGLVIGIIARYKKLRTFPNMLLANLSLVDFLNAFINMPLFFLYGVIGVSWLKGKVLAIVVLYFSRLFTLLHLVSMLVLLVNMFLALKFGLRYFTWKTNEKAIAIVLVEWFVCVVVTSTTVFLLHDVDLRDAHVLRYRQTFFRQGKYLSASSTALFIVLTIMLGVLVIYSVRVRKKLQVSQAIRY